MQEHMSFVFLPMTTDMVSAETECVACITLGCQVGSGLHTIWLLALQQQPMCQERQISLKHDVIDNLAVVAALFLF